MKSAKLEITRFENEDVITASGSKGSTAMGYYGISYYFIDECISALGNRGLITQQDGYDNDDDHTSYLDYRKIFYFAKFANASDFYDIKGIKVGKKGALVPWGKCGLFFATLRPAPS